MFLIGLNYSILISHIINGNDTRHNTVDIITPTEAYSPVLSPATSAITGTIIPVGEAHKIINIVKTSPESNPVFPIIK